jgi:NADH-quinone oxidoreductase subunit E
MQDVAKIVGITETDVAALVGFYTLYHDKKEGKYRMQVCTDLPCALRGAEGFMDALCANLGIKVGETTADGFVTVEAVTCLAACDKAPMFQTQGPDGIKYHENMNVDRTMELISVLRRSSREVEG